MSGNKNKEMRKEEKIKDDRKKMKKGEMKETEKVDRKRKKKKRYTTMKKYGEGVK